MKKFLVALMLSASAVTAQASNFDFFGNDGEWKMGPNGPYYEESDWPEWTPMYWMEEFMDVWDDDDDYGSYGAMPPMAMPYGGAPMMMPQGNFAAPGMMPMPMQAPAMPMPGMQAAPGMMQMPAMPMPAMPAAPAVTAPAPVAPAPAATVEAK